MDIFWITVLVVECILLLLGAMVAVFYGTVIFIRAFRVSIWWGLGSMFVPGVHLAFVIVYWQLIKDVFFKWLVGMAVWVICSFALKEEAFKLYKDMDSNKTGVEKCIKGNCENGYGTYDYGDGTQYVGEWKNNCREGHGEITTRPPFEYKIEGEWVNDELEGQGTFSAVGRVDVTTQNQLNRTKNTRPKHSPLCGKKHEAEAGSDNAVTSKQDNETQETGKQETVDQETVKQDSAIQETSKQDNVAQQTVKQDDITPEAVKQDSATPEVSSLTQSFSRNESHATTMEESRKSSGKQGMTDAEKEKAFLKSFKTSAECESPDLSWDNMVKCKNDKMNARANFYKTH